MSDLRQRRFESLSAAVPEAVKVLDARHPALRDKRTIFPSTVVDAAHAPRLLVSGMNNRKIGRMVTKGEWAGMPIYTLTLEERATCPPSCHMWASCYGNAMQWARRHRHGEDLVKGLGAELADKARGHPKGFVVRLHVLGDFYSVAYVDFWRAALMRHPELRVFGYTARRIDGDLEDRAIAMRIAGLNSALADRFVIRTSAPEPGPMRAVVIDRVPDIPKVPEGIVCPAETQAASCCAECGLCWSKAARKESIVFIRHGLGSRNDAALARRMVIGADGMRPVERLNLGLPSSEISAPAGAAPYFVEADPRTLLIDEAYQRSLSVRGIKLIRDMVLRWDWSKFKPPVVTENEDGRRFAIDGQHTAIAAASHPEIETIPIQIINAGSVAKRAQAFLGHNRDRIAVTPLQLHRALVAAQDPVSLTIDRICKATGAKILATPPPTGVFAVGETIALASVRGLIEKRGEKRARNVLMVCVQGRCAPISADHIKAVDFLVHSDDHLRLNYDWHKGDVLDAADVAMFMRSRGADLIRQATMRRMQHGRLWARWVILAEEIYAGMKEAAHG